ncbi:tetratricopeptide repeat protein [Marinimicrobium sp. ABcell2]|uniref:tetratricopeptide repeat protein n=1 Tax=Marinimicrobium sp. ABcell2 TaxID=3069751 RepID=UPI0027B57037|nr:tetratricopeptide repeat protein [Marinimicrobium sp. ABcell2]MDQ2076910.1 tetratricopeptide repeat protein [Marinimicrobium sp. ABcell2]
MMRTIRVVPVVLLALGLLCSMAVSANDRTAYREGIAAFQNSDFSQALEYFQQAEAKGLRTVALFYNLGSTHYRLNQYDESSTYFQRIRDDSQWSALAEYNLGLIAERQEDLKLATKHYQAAYRKADSDRVRDLAQARIKAITGSAATKESGNWLVYLSGAVGSDDNPALTQDTQVVDDSSADSFAEIIGNVSGYLSGTPGNGVRLSGGLYSRQYNEMSEFSVSGVDVGLYLDSQTKNWSFVRGARVNNFWIDGNQYSAGANVMLRATQRNRMVNLDIRNDLGLLNGGADYEFISGIRNRLTLDLYHRNDALEWRLGYRNEYNARGDLETEQGQFFSYSPMRHSVYAQLLNEFSDEITLRTRVEYRKSLYPEDNIEIDPETDAVTQMTRDEDRVDFSALLRYSFNKTFSVFSEYRYTDNDSNFGRFSYKSNQMMLGLEAIF